jgi:hypothetical protein
VLLVGLARADVVASLRRRRPPRLVLPRRRVGSLAGWLRLLPALLADRRKWRANVTVNDQELMRWALPRSAHPF